MVFRNITTIEVNYPKKEKRKINKTQVKVAQKSNLNISLLNVHFIPY